MLLVNYPWFRKVMSNGPHYMHILYNLEMPLNSKNKTKRNWKKINLQDGFSVSIQYSSTSTDTSVEKYSSKSTDSASLLQ